MLPIASDPRWRQVVSGAVKPKFEFLAVKILLGRIGLDLAKDNSAHVVTKGVFELRTLLDKYQSLPSAKRDIEKIFGGAR